MAFMFENLQVYQKAVSFAGAVCSLTNGFPRGCFFLADQLNRAALSIAANIAEGNGRFTKRRSVPFLPVPFAGPTSGSTTRWCREWRRCEPSAASS